jgi:chorismate-pyruvate lyase
MEQGVPETTFDRPKLYDLIGLFYSQPERLGKFERRKASQCPLQYRKLLAHNAHMTVTVEQRHGELVDVEVLQEAQDAHEYQRKILLRKRSDQKVVQYGIVRIDLRPIDGEIRDQIQSGRTPLGRILIEHDLMREVQLSGLWRVECGEDLAEHFGVDIGCITYGRTARILVESTPMIELLEIVAPEPEVGEEPEVGKEPENRIES